MVGNLDYIIDIVAEKHNLDRRYVEVVAKETFKRFKSRITYTDAFSIYVPKLGFFIPMHRKLRRYIGDNVRSLRKLRIKLKQLEKELEKENTTELQEKIQNLKNIEAHYIQMIRNSWTQLNYIRYLIIENKRRITEWVKKKEALGIPYNKPQI